ncbi:hypothetical protein TCAL_08289 [Tigriopus californicus]|uniref:RING-type E3 ubiquitin transferase n=1 Tax=Tigriopus californicus TaxID=6832 RepID=A0A553NEL3_TIGCA|nr:hypothetical protein TCAL_08289 [Tigriopus californicus]|eukprot:TCALIF_08289-PA protein Name:"Similar to siah1 E3 ubiquitin-protein ligase Siah1 (Danio rerio)" AED:0.08 eAED:0.09 QI:0/-1/0/1/-1/1/1/0/298
MSHGSPSDEDQFLHFEATNPCSTVTPLLDSTLTPSLDPSWLEQLKSVLQCGVCGFICTPKLYQCTNGHLTCNQCLASLNKCPMCRDTSILNRNLTAERILMLLDPLLPCTYHPYGCGDLLCASDLAAHEALCACRPYPCPEMSCHRSDSLAAIHQHFVTSHSFKHFNASASTEELGLPETDRKMTMMGTIPKMFQCYKQVFLAHTAIYKGQLTIMTQILGNQDLANRFDYEITTHRGLGQMPHVFQARVQPLSQGQRFLLKYGPTFRLSLDEIPLHPFRGRVLWHTIAIHPANSKPHH